jgi:hypothetical protein
VQKKCQMFIPWSATNVILYAPVETIVLSTTMSVIH